MISTTLFSAVALAIGGGHAGLHPANTNLYFEVPDVREMLAAYDEAPLARLIADPEVQAFVAQLSGQEPEHVTLNNLTQVALEELRSELPDVGLLVLDMVTAVDHVSLSVSGANLDGIYELVAASEGEFSDELLGRLSGLHARFVVDFVASETATDAAHLIRESVRSQADEVDGPWIMASHQLASAEHPEEWSAHVNNEGKVEVSLFVGNLGNRLTLDFGFAQNPDVWPVVNDALAGRKSYVQAGTHFKGDGGVTIVGSYFTISGIGELPKLWTLIPGIPEGFSGMAEYFLSQVAPGGEIEVRSHTRLVEGRFITETFERSLGGAETPQLTSDEPITKANFRMAAPDAVGVWAMNLNKEGMSELLLDGLAQVSGEDPEKILATLDDKYGFQPQRDLIKPLGGELVFYTMPFAGIGVPKMFIALELDDSEAFARGMEGVAEFLRDTAGDAIEIRSKPYRKQPFLSFSPGSGLSELTSGNQAGGMAELSPALDLLNASIGILEDRAVIALSSMYVKREIKRLLKAPDDEQHPVMTSGEEFPVGVRSYGVTDWGAVLAGLYDSVRGFLPLIEQGADFTLPFKIEEMPDSSIFSEYITPSVNWSRAIEGGIYSRGQSAFGPEIPFAFGAAGVIGGLYAVSGLEDEMVVAIEPENPKPVIENITLDTLQELKVAVQIYKAEHGHLPAELMDLLEGTANFPRGLLGVDSLPSDEWGGEIRYSAGADGSSYRLWSKGHDGVDNGGSGDDVLLER